MGTNFLIYMSIMVGIIFGIESYGDYTKSECAKAYATTTRTADEIAKICK